MALLFCFECGSILKEEGKCLVCDKCKKSFMKFGEDMKEEDVMQHKSKVGGGVVSDKNIYATYDHKCPKCGYGKAQVIDMGVFYSDEDNLILIQCGKCGNTERVGRKTS